MRGFEAVSVIAADEIDEVNHIAFLSAKETERYRSISDPGRRKRWLGGRLAAKHLFLTRLESNREGTIFEVVRLNAATLKDYPSWIYREVEVLPSRWRESGIPRISWVGTRRPTHVSLAHTLGLAAACLDEVHPVGVDVEAPRPWSECFCRTNFTPAERQWTESFCGRTGPAADRLYAALWCLKESAVKATESEDASVLSVPRIEVKLNCPPDVLDGILRSGLPLGRLLSVEIEVHDGCQTRVAEAAMAAVYGSFLTVVRFRQEGS